MADEAAKKFKDMVENFKKLCDESMKGQSDSWSKLLQSGQANFAEIQKHFTKGYEEMLQQLVTANNQLLEKLGVQYKNLKEQLQSTYAVMEKQSTTNFEKQLDTFKKNCEDILKKYPMLPPTIHADAIKDLKAMQGKSQADIKKQYNNLMEHLEKNYNETVKKMTLPQGLVQQAVSKVKEAAEAVGAGSSKK